MTTTDAPGAPTLWIDGPLLGFDTETTGTDVTRDRIVTAALVLSHGPGREAETVATWLIDPGVEIPEAAAAVHGISTAHAREHGMQPAEALEEVGLSADYAAAAHSRGDGQDSWEPALRSYQSTAIAKVGDDVGTPVIELDGRAFFGPVLTRVPRGEQAGVLFDAAVTLGSYEHFFEIKKSRTEDPSAE